MLSPVMSDPPHAGVVQMVDRDSVFRTDDFQSFTAAAGIQRAGVLSCTSEYLGSGRSGRGSGLPREAICHIDVDIGRQVPSFLPSGTTEGATGNETWNISPLESFSGWERIPTPSSISFHLQVKIIPLYPSLVPNQAVRYVGSYIPFALAVLSPRGRERTPLPHPPHPRTNTQLPTFFLPSLPPHPLPSHPPHRHPVTHLPRT